MMKITLVGLFGSLMIYLFATAPEALPDRTAATAGRCNFEVTALFDGVNAINDAARSIYIKRIVGGGKEAGLKFGEDWQEPGVEKGPLPALFLRLTAARLETKPPRLGLYLGSDAPINKSNLFTEAQMVSFATVKSDRAPVFSASDQGRAIGMYPDVAGLAPCVDCHNDHEDSPKTDWKIDDVMGATTWTYPTDVVSADDYFATIEAMFDSVEEAYQQYLNRTSGFAQPVIKAQEWPGPGVRILPERAAFMAEVRTRAAPALVDALLPLGSETTEEMSPCVF